MAVLLTRDNKITDIGSLWLTKSSFFLKYSSLSLRTCRTQQTVYTHVQGAARSWLCMTTLLRWQSNSEQKACTASNCLEASLYVYTTYIWDKGGQSCTQLCVYITSTHRHVHTHHKEVALPSLLSHYSAGVLPQQLSFQMWRWLGLKRGRVQAQNKELTYITSGTVWSWLNSRHCLAVPMYTGCSFCY